MPKGPFTETTPSRTLISVEVGSVIGFLPIRDLIESLNYHIENRASPPSFSLLASLPDITPLDVERIREP